VLLGYLFYWSGNLWISILAHFFNNGIQVLMYYLFQRGIISYDIEKEENFPMAVILGFTILFGILMYVFYQKNRKEITAEEKL